MGAALVLCYCALLVHALIEFYLPALTYCVCVCYCYKCIYFLCCPYGAVYVHNVSFCF